MFSDKQEFEAYVESLFLQLSYCKQFLYNQKTIQDRLFSSAKLKYRHIPSDFKSGATMPDERER